MRTHNHTFETTSDGVFYHGAELDDLSYGALVRIGHLEVELHAARDKGYTHAKIEMIMGGYEPGDEECGLVLYRPETDEERTKRLAEAAAKEQQQVEYEKRQLKRLLDKYGAAPCD